jgi:hypothetical protein
MMAILCDLETGESGVELQTGKVREVTSFSVLTFASPAVTSSVFPAVEVIMCLVIKQLFVGFKISV